MLLIKLEQKKSSSNLKTVTFRLEKKLIDEFKALSKELGIKQATIIRNAMKIAIKEMENKKYDR